ncbi:hypothetical protein BDR05DRAFT_1059735, partial [Suillus weaverae]
AFRLYLVPHLCVNHGLVVVVVTFLQHTDPILPHYRVSEFTFFHGALAPFGRNLLGDWLNHGLDRCPRWLEGRLQCFQGVHGRGQHSFP